MKTKLLWMITVALIVSSATLAAPLKVFILAGQSNMVGQGEISPITTMGTLEYIVANEQETFGHLKDETGWVVRDDVRIWYNNNGNPRSGGLTAGYGGSSATIGPELQFGHVMGNYFSAPVLIIKTAWGGKSLAVDFRPPSSGDINDELSFDPPITADAQGYYYRLMLSHVSTVLDNLSTYVPGYDAAEGYQIVGFGWHQGWNDRVNQSFNDQYERNMKNFIKDVRQALGASNLPFVIATTGMSGWDETHPRALSLMEAQLAMEDFTKYPEFEGNVAVDDTRDYWIDPSLSPVPSGNQAYHWNRNAKIYCNIGNGMALEMIDILVDPNAPAVDAGSDTVTWSGEPVLMDPNVVEKTGSTWTNLTYQWTAEPNTGVEFSDDQALDPAVTMTGPTGNPTVVTLTLSVNDSGRAEPPVRDTAQIHVYDDNCKAARLGFSLAGIHPSDIAGEDCVTNLEDITRLASSWQYYTGLTEPQIK